MKPNFNLAGPFSVMAPRHPARIAICADGAERTYAQTLAAVRRTAQWLSDGTPPRYVGIMASRSWEACVGILAALWSGATYVPLSLSQPADRLCKVLNSIPLDALITDQRGATQLTPEVMRFLPPKVLVPSTQDVPCKAECAVQTLDALDTDCNFEPLPVDPENPAYIIFTSGSTGTPKGVIIPNRAVVHFCEVMQRRYEIQPEDRVAEPVDASFDLSVFNMFMTWAAGASLHVVPKNQAMGPAKFIRDHATTVWFSVPSVATAMHRMGMLTPGALPSLRVSLFAGEALPATVATAWMQAASNSVVDNCYGPTETTVVCHGQRLRNRFVITPERDIMAIGDPLEGTEAAIWDSNRDCLGPHIPGELAIAGPQVALGYLNDRETTAAKFVRKNGKLWYLSGDLAYQDDAGLYHHLGRLDNQVKVLGFRVELEEVETHLRQVYGTESAAAIAWPIQFGTATGIVGFVSTPKTANHDLKHELRERMPSYMVPTAVHLLDTLPTNTNGKVDRKALAQKLQAGEF